MLVGEKGLRYRYPRVPHRTDLVITRAAVAIDLTRSHDVCSAWRNGIGGLRSWEIVIARSPSVYSHAAILWDEACRRVAGGSAVAGWMGWLWDDDSAQVE